VLRRNGRLQTVCRGHCQERHEGRMVGWVGSSVNEEQYLERYNGRELDLHQK
jgi:hypothetical protein